MDGYISGDVTVERYIDSGETGWRFLCAPVTGATFDQWKDDFITSGFSGSHFPEFNFASIYTYDETATGNQNNGFGPLSNISSTISPTSGYWVYSGDSLNDTDPFTIDVTGPVNVGAVNFPVSYTLSLSGITQDGWNLVSNPYASSINWDAAGWTKLFIDNAVYVWNTDLNQYASYVGGLSTNGGSNAIASSQAFYVKANAPLPVLSITETCKLNASNTPFLKERGIEDPVIRITVSDRNGNRDETVLRINESASRAFDPEFDAYYLTSHTSTKIYSTMSGDKHSIDGFPLVGIDTIPLIMKASETSVNLTYALNELAEQLCITLLDKQSMQLTPLDQRLESFRIELNSEDTSRYAILLSHREPIGITVCDMITGKNDIAPAAGTPVYISNNAIYLKDLSLLGSSFEVYNTLGQNVWSGVFNSVVTSLDDQLSHGLYVLTLNGSSELNKKFTMLE